MGDPNGSIPTIEPLLSQPMWGSYPSSAALNSISFVSQVSLTNGMIKSYGLKKRFEAVKNCRNVRKGDMKWNDRKPKMEVDPESYEVKADGVHLVVEPATSVPLARGYNFF